MPNPKLIIKTAVAQVQGAWHHWTAREERGPVVCSYTLAGGRAQKPITVSRFSMRADGPTPTAIFVEIFKQAVDAMLELIKHRRFELKSEMDVSALIFHHAFLVLEGRGLPLALHAEPTSSSKRPDLAFGENELFVEVKLSKPNAGGYTQALAKWRADINKLRYYRLCNGRTTSFFLAIDDGGYHSRANSKNFFDPAANGLIGIWKPINTNTYFLLGELQIPSGT